MTRALADGRLSEEAAGTWRRLNGEQRVAGIAAGLLIVSTLGPFSFVEAGIVLTGAAVLLLLRRRAQAREFHLPFGDGTVIAAAGLWSALLILVRLFDRPLGQGLLALVCAALLFGAGVRERAKRPMDDLPGRPRPTPRPRDRPRARARRGPGAPPGRAASSEERTVPLVEGPVEFRPGDAPPEQESLPGLEEQSEPTRRIPPG